MNRRATTTFLILLLLALLLILWSLKPPQEITKKPITKKPSALREATTVPLEDVLGEPEEVEALSAPEEPKAIIDVISHSGWLNPTTGNYEVFGEVQNFGQRTARDVRVNINFRDINFIFLSELEVSVQRPNLPPGQRSAFKATLTDKKKSVQVASYIILTKVRRP